MSARLNLLTLVTFAMLAALVTTAAADDLVRPIPSDPAPSAKGTDSDPTVPPPAAPTPAAAVYVAAPAFSPDPALLRRLESLKEQRNAIRIGVPIGLAAAGLGLLVGGVALGIDALLYADTVGICGGFGGCLSRPATRALGTSGAVLGAGGIALIAIGIPKLRARLGARRALSAEIQRLRREARLAFDLGPARAALVLQGRF